MTLRAATLSVLLLAGPAEAQDLGTYVERAMAEWGVPGVAVAVVKDGRPVLVRGFGVREMGKTARVDARTVFPIASLSKGFTAAVAATLVDEGRLGWDDRVADLVPGFQVADPWVSREVTLRDLLAHRTGWQPELDWLWVGTGHPREEILARLRHVTQAEGFRAGYSYHNVTYLLAAEALARRAGRPWEALVRERIFRPLGMTSSYPTLAEARRSGRLAASHSDLHGPLRPVPPEDGDAVAPAAGVHASAGDMVRWMLAQLGDGRIGAARAWSEEAARAMRTPQNLMPIGPTTRRLWPETRMRAYGLGWVLQVDRGVLVMWNTGGMTGSSCSIALVPERGIGVAVLTNGPRTSFPEAIVWRALDSLLAAPPRDWSALRRELSVAAREQAAQRERARDSLRVRGTRPSLTASAYAGTYRQDLLGPAAVTLERGRMQLALGRLRGTLEHWQHDTFLIRWENPLYGTSLATFQLGIEPRVERLVLEEIGTFERAGDR